MKIFTSGVGGKEHYEELIDHGLGVLISPGQSIREYFRDIPVAIDNGAYSAFINDYGFDEYGFLKLLHQVRKKSLRPEFIVAPDIVGGGLESLEFSLYWRKRLPGYPLYLAVQDGMSPLHVAPIVKHFKGLFVGGTRQWKFDSAALWVDLAHTHGIKCHIGGVGSKELLLWADGLGADSVDSTSFSRNCTFHYATTYKGDREDFPLLYAA